MIFNLETSNIIGNSARGVVDREDLLICWWETDQLRISAQLFLQFIDYDLLSLLGRLLSEKLGGLAHKSKYFGYKIYYRFISWNYDALGLVFETILLQYCHFILENGFVVLVQ